MVANSVIFATARSAFERRLSPASAEALRDQMIAMCGAYLRDAARRADGGRFTE